MKDLSDIILVAAGVLVSLAFRYVPKLNDWFDKQNSGTKALLNLGAALLVAVVYFALACTVLAAQLNIAVTCDQQGAIALALAFVKIVIGNQGAFLLTPSKQ